MMYITGAVDERADSWMIRGGKLSNGASGGAWVLEDGDTVVTVRENVSFGALFFEFRKKEERIYIGEWGEYAGMEIYWSDGSTLIVNSNVYTIK